MTDDQKLRMLFEYGELRATKTVEAHFAKKAELFAELPNPSNWRALKRAMVYLQAHKSNTRDHSLTPLLDAGFSDET